MNAVVRQDKAIYTPGYLTIKKVDTPPFGSYTLLWTSGECTWYEAEDTCQQMGMHLASISTADEFQLVTGLLAGQGYRRATEARILTPCRTLYPLCIVFIGLQIQVCQS